MDTARHHARGSVAAAEGWHAGGEQDMVSADPGAGTPILPLPHTRGNPDSRGSFGPLLSLLS